MSIISSFVVTILLSHTQFADPTSIAGFIIFVALVSFVTGVIGVVKCIRHRHVLTLGQKIIGWTASLIALTIIGPLIIFGCIAYFILRFL